MRLLQLLLLLLVLVLQLPAAHVQRADASFSNTDTAEESCSPEVYWVNCGGSCGVGSETDPFCSISSALEAAQSSTCGVTVNVENSWCSENLSITEDTVIAGLGSLTTIDGTITNDSGCSLRLQDLAVYGKNGQEAVSVDGEQADTVLDSVTIESATGYGVRQNGGRLDASGLVVVGTSALPTESAPGAAICLEGGVRSTLDHVQLFDNQVAGLVVSGNTTSADLGDLLINEQIESLRVPGFVDRVDSHEVQVRDGGRLTAAWHR